MSDSDTLVSLTNMMTTNLVFDLSVMSDFLPFTNGPKISRNFPLRKRAEIPGTF